MRALLLGANGQLGMELRDSFWPLCELKTCTREDVDFENLQELRLFIEEYEPELILNAAAYTDVDKAESESERAFRINADAVFELAKQAKRHNALLIHFSTDFVFDGQKKENYIEEDRPNPLNIYGRSKLQGEKLITQSGCKHLIFRTSWIFSRHGTNFIKTILELAREKEILHVVADQRGKPTSAKFIAHIAAKGMLAAQTGCLHSGIYHLASNNEASWCDVAQYVVDVAHKIKMPIKLKKENVLPIALSQYKHLAKRPVNSALNSSLLAKKLDISMVDWKIDAYDVINHFNEIG
ncbi:MAG: dTDP-4-dehydrorhamnose reductase [Legionella sp.]|nr:MAG: dTDP-4-dehydrorhamnose reductase [Legionella sp.]